MNNISLCPGYNTGNITVCQIFYGRLGNNMFIYASNMCLAKKYGFRLLIPNFLEIVRIFRLTEETIDFWKLHEFCKGSERHKGLFETKFIMRTLIFRAPETLQ
ncbi:hypothetical protein FSP39_012592 [Pinctada imbricata]|uniref:Uncharacterized protein n=1 Tax=Pinctada imbricata TaxID=66713 RepID=A0AA88YQU5_PINIB|nr:hypothetical protein FSP39_012592 [Pinctada imbricata]